jgi:energy-coupling factor transporter ATP-binding protein EcfA2
VIRLQNISYRVRDFDGTEKHVLADISAEFHKGTRIALMGANGSGKTTLAKLIAGLAAPSSGEIRIDSFLTTGNEFREHLGSRVGFLFQNPEHQMISVNVERELALGLENQGCQRTEMGERVAAFLKTFGLERIRHSSTAMLSGGEKQILALASVMILRPDILILDEPTAHLDMAGKALFRTELDRYMTDTGLTILQITREYEEIKDFDRLIILAEGRIVEDCSPDHIITDRKKLDRYKIEYPPSVFQSKVDGIKSREKFKSILPTESGRARDGDSRAELECNGVKFGWGNDPGGEIICDLDFALRSGQVHGILGRTGCGKTTLALLLAGLLKPREGEIRLDGRIVRREQLVNSVAYLFQSPERSMFASSLYEDIAYGPRNFGIAGEVLDRIVKKTLEQTGLDYENFRRRSPFNLSGGEARLAAIAGGIATGKRIIILDEPTEELDSVGKSMVKRLILNLAGEGKAVMVISHDADFLFAVSDIISLWIDKKPETHPKYELYKSRDLFEMAGSDMPKVICLAAEYELEDEFITSGIDSLDHPQLKQFTAL